MRIITADLCFSQVNHILSVYPFTYLVVDPEMTPELSCVLADDMGKAKQIVGIYELCGCWLISNKVFDSFGNVTPTFELTCNWYEAKAVYEQFITDGIDMGLHVWSEIEK